MTLDHGHARVLYAKLVFSDPAGLSTVTLFIARCLMPSEPGGVSSARPFPRPSLTTQRVFSLSARKQTNIKKDSP